jgi:hypothetical protein
MKFRHQSLRNPGQSLDEQIDRVVLDEWAGYVLAAACLWLVAIVEWASRMFDLPRIPAIYALAAVVATTLLFWKTRETRRQLELLRQGRDGERAVAEFLDELRRDGAQVLHDIPDDRGNVDHVIICRQGVFVIETKAWSKPDHVWSLDFDGERVQVAGRPANAEPIMQCRAEASSIRSLLRESTSKPFPVRGVLVFPEWFVRRTGRARESDIWVLNPKELAGWIRREVGVLSDADVAMAALHLKQYVKKLAA